MGLTTTLPAAEVAARLRAARAYADITQRQMATTIGRGHVYMRELEDGTRPARPGEIYEVAVASGLPIEFFTAEWASLGDEEAIAA